MNQKRILIVSQVMPQWYIDLILQVLPQNSIVDCITGSNLEKVNIISSPVYNSISFKTKFISWIKHCFFVIKWMKKNKSEHYDLIFAVSNPPMNAFLGIKLKKIFNAPFIFMNWDLYPQSIEAEFSNPIIKFICKFWHKLNDYYYPQIDKMLTIGEVMCQTINQSLNKKIQVLNMPIAVDVEQIKPIEAKQNSFRIKYKIEDKFVVLFSGNMGYGRNVDIVLEAAKKLVKNNKIAFMLIGNGKYYEVAKKQIEEDNLENTIILPLQPSEIYPFSIACGDVAIVTQNIKQAHLSIPSRTYSMMAAGEAIIGICTYNDDLQKLIDDNKIGIKIIDNNAQKLADAIQWLYENQTELLTMQQNARLAAENKYSLEKISQKYKSLFDKYL